MNHHDAMENVIAVLYSGKASAKILSEVFGTELYILS